MSSIRTVGSNSLCSVHIQGEFNVHTYTLIHNECCFCWKQFSTLCPSKVVSTLCPSKVVLTFVLSWAFPTFGLVWHVSIFYLSWLLVQVNPFWLSFREPVSISYSKWVFSTFDLGRFVLAFGLEWLDFIYDLRFTTSSRGRKKI